MLIDMDSGYFQTISKVFIISAGRTGTQFLSLAIPKVIPNCFAVHEPDKIDLQTLNLKEAVGRCIRQGPLKLTILKALGYSGTRNYSLKRLKGEMGGQEVIKKIIQDRKWIPNGYNTYVECNFQLFGIVEDLIRIPNSQIIFIVREPNDWALSWLNRGLFGPMDNMYRINRWGLKRLTPENIGIKNNFWNVFSRLDKIFWTWLFLNNYFLSLSNKYPKKTHIFQFENIFQKKKIYDLEKFLKIIEKNSNSFSTKNLTNLLNTKINISSVKRFHHNNLSKIKINSDLESSIIELKNKLGYFQ